MYLFFIRGISFISLFCIFIFFFRTSQTFKITNRVSHLYSCYYVSLTVHTVFLLDVQYITLSCNKQIQIVTFTITCFCIIFYYFLLLCYSKYKPQIGQLFCTINTQILTNLPCLSCVIYSLVHFYVSIWNYFPSAKR
jgi:hypothetical protein